MPSKHWEIFKWVFPHAHHVDIFLFSKFWNFILIGKSKYFKFALLNIFNTIFKCNKKLLIWQSNLNITMKGSLGLIFKFFVTYCLSCHSSFNYISRRIEILISHKNLCMSVHCDFIYNNQYFNRPNFLNNWMDEYISLHVYNGILAFSNYKKFSLCVIILMRTSTWKWIYDI